MPNTPISTWHPISGTLRRRTGSSQSFTRQASLAGADPIGTRDYAIPVGALFVSPSGNDSTGSGTQAAPYRTLKYAASVVPANGTIVMRAGEYHEGGVYWRAEDSSPGGNATLGGIFFANSGVTVQNYPGEAAWLEGAVPVTNWMFDGTNWRTSFVTKFDHTATHTRGDDTNNWPGGGGFVVPEYPFAAWPEQLFLNGVRLKTVDDVADLGPGKFCPVGTYVGGAGVNKNVYITTEYVMRDNPTGQQVRISDLSRVMTINQANITLRGIGVRRYTASLVDWGGVFCTNDQPGFTLEHCYVQDMGMIGVSARGNNTIIRHNTIDRCGQEGVQVSRGMSGIICEYNLFRQNVCARFNYGPDAGPLKFGIVWNAIVRYNRFEDNFGHDLWFDQSNYMNIIHGNDFIRPYGRAIAYEISAKLWIIDNYFEDVGLATDLASRQKYDCNPIWISGSSDIYIWNNTFVNSAQFVKIAQDPRSPTAPGTMDRYGRDNRQPEAFYDGSDPGYEHNGAMTWTTQNIVVKNNIFYGPAPGHTVEHVFYNVRLWSNETWRPGRTTAQGNIETGGNLYNRLSTTATPRFINGSGEAYGSVEIFNSMTGNATVFPGGASTPSWKTITGETGSVLIDNRSAFVASSYPWTVNPSDLTSVTPTPLPADIAAKFDRSAGEAHLGAWLT